jgi:type I restriction enzyme S subunit
VIAKAYRIGDVCSIIRGIYPTLKTEPGKYPLVVTAAFRRSSSTFQLEGPAVCVPLISSTGHGDAALHRVHYQEGKFALANLLVALISKDKAICDPKYLYHLLMAKKDEYFVPLMLGTANVSLKEQDIAGVEITLPSLQEQRRIVSRIEELASRVEKARELRKQSAAGINDFIPSYLSHLFDEATASGRDQIRLGDFCTFSGGSQPAKFQFAYEPRYDYVRLIQIRDYKSDDHLTYVPRDSVRKFCSNDDVMIGRYGPPIFQILRGLEGAYNVALIKASPNTQRLSKEFLFYLLKEPRLFQKVDEDSQRTSGQTGVRKELLEEHVAFVPSLDEQRAIVKTLDNLTKTEEALKSLQSEAAAQLDAVMPSILSKAFGGEL